jgi:DNA polymerase
MKQDKTKQLNGLKTKLTGFTATPLYSFRTENKYQPVLGDGSPDADIVFIGEAPGKKEAETGHPFCGAAGKMLDKLLATVKLSRDDIYITNLVNDRPPDNRDPKPAEIAAYSPFLLELLSIIKPQVIVTLGRFSLNYLLETYPVKESGLTIKELHGRIIPMKFPHGRISLVPLYHPAYALYNGSMKKILEKDIAVLTDLEKNVRV